VLGVTGLWALGSASNIAVLPLGLPGLPLHLRLDPLSAFFLILLGGASFGVSLYGAGYFKTMPGNVRVGGEELFNFAQARSHFARHLLLNCSGNPGVVQLMEILKPWSEGECRVQIQYSNGVASCQLRLGSNWQVTLSDELMNDLRLMLQPENVKVVYN
jgi:hypothetical protein